MIFLLRRQWKRAGKLENLKTQQTHYVCWALSSIRYWAAVIF